MFNRLIVAAALIAAATTTRAADPVRPQPGETVVSFQCRTAHIPEARACAARCDAAFAANGTARFECVHACTKHGLYDMAQCRGQGGVVAVAGMVASR
jgi:hypothetical protein